MVRSTYVPNDNMFCMLRGDVVPGGGMLLERGVDCNVTWEDSIKTHDREHYGVYCDRNEIVCLF